MNNTYQNIVLTPEHLSNITKYRTSFGDKWVEESIEWAQADIYIDNNFNCVSQVRKTPFRCTNTGIDTYERKDGQVITADDIAAFHRRHLGQMNKISGNPGDLRIIQEWLCDSSD